MTYPWEAIYTFNPKNPVDVKRLKNVLDKFAANESVHRGNHDLGLVLKVASMNLPRTKEVTVTLVTYDNNGTIETVTLDSDDAVKSWTLNLSWRYKHIQHNSIIQTVTIND